MDMQRLEAAADCVRQRLPRAKPFCAVILGSGWSDAAESFAERAAIDYADIPALGATGVPGHAGRLVYGTADDLELLLFMGRRHVYEGAGWEPVAAPVFTACRLGCAVLLLTNAAGGLRDGLAPGAFMVIDDHINLMNGNPLIGPAGPLGVDRFPDQTCVYDADLRGLLDAAAPDGAPFAHGVYAAVPGPAYETPAEVRALRALGADAVGMSTVPEAMLGRAAGLRVAALSCITNAGAGLSDRLLSHDEVVRVAADARPRMAALLDTFCRRLAAQRDRFAP